MGVFDFFKKKQVESVSIKKQPSAFERGRVLFTHTFTGEKNLGELGPIKAYTPDYYSLSVRAWQAFLESDICHTVINRYATWVIGSGLKMQTEPVKKILQKKGINIDQEFNEDVEARWTIYSKSKRCDYSGRKSLGQIAKEAFINGINGGDVLLVLRYQNKQKTIQMIDGCHVKSPQGGSDYMPQYLSNGNYIKNGIEYSNIGEIEAYHVQNWNLKYERIPAKSEVTGLTVAFMFYGSTYRIDSSRGIPLLSVIFETIKKLERYKEATVGSAEERQKIAFSVEHNIASTGENPLAQQMTKAFNYVEGSEDLPIDQAGKELASTVAATTNKQAFNLPPGAKLVQLSSDNELNFPGFYEPNVDIVCSAVGIPPDVAKSKYNSNFSASRAALKDWEHTLNVKRADFVEQFYKPIYEFWFHIEVLENNIQATGYLTAFNKNDFTTVEAYRNVRFIGAPVPHIDPEKEVRAARLKLGDTGSSIPLSTVEAVTESLNGGEAYENMDQYAKELEQSKSLGIKLEIPAKASQ